MPLSYAMRSKIFSVQFSNFWISGSWAMNSMGHTCQKYLTWTIVTVQYFSTWIQKVDFNAFICVSLLTFNVSWWSFLLVLIKIVRYVASCCCCSNSRFLWLKFHSKWFQIFYILHAYGIISSNSLLTETGNAYAAKNVHAWKFFLTCVIRRKNFSVPITSSGLYPLSLTRNKNGLQVLH